MEDRDGPVGIPKRALLYRGIGAQAGRLGVEEATVTLADRDDGE
jgi:hypothetical protein